MAVRIGSASLSATVHALGAELQTLQDASGRDLLWDGDPAVWKGRAPLLFPIVGRLPNDTLHSGGRDYPMRQHGLARITEFTLAAHTPSSCDWVLESNDATRAQFPFEFALRMTYAIEDATLSLTAHVKNRGQGAMPCSFGFHPAFRWPLPGGGAKTDCRIVFDEAEPAPIRRLADGLLKPASVASPVVGRELRLDDSLFEPDAMIFDRLQSRGLVYEGAQGPKLRVTFPEMPHLGIWSKPGAGFVCIEPWQGYAAPEDFASDFAEKPGLVDIAPGGTRAFAMAVTIIEG